MNVVSTNKIYIYMLLGEERHCENDTSCFSKNGTRSKFNITAPTIKPVHLPGYRILSDFVFV